MEETKQGDTELLRLSEPAIYFEPISSLTNVFFDRDNQQIFCVRSNGVGGVIVKGARAELNTTFRMEDKGNVATIKFSGNMNILAIRRKDKCVIDFLNFKNSQPVFPEYSQAFRAKSTKFQECYWLDNLEILLVSEQGFEHYQIFPDKRALKLIKYFSMPLNWLIWSREIQVFVVSTGSYGSVLNPFFYTKGSFIKLPKFEVDLPLPLNLNKYRYSIDTTQAASSTNPNRYYLNESDVVIGRIYNEFYVMIIRQISFSEPEVKPIPGQRSNRSPLNTGYSEIHMYKLLTDSPAKKTNILKINLSGRFTLNVIDELIIVHHRASYSSMIFDIKMPGEFDGYVVSNLPVIKRATIRSTVLEGLDESPALTEMYSMNWIMFLPNVIIDAKLGCFWFMQLNLDLCGSLAPLAEIESDYLKLVEFLLNRGNTKTHLLNTCRLLIRNKSSLKLIEQVFEKINHVYKCSLLAKPAEDGAHSVADCEFKSWLSNDAVHCGDHLPVLEQYDMHNQILYPLLEEDKWWTPNAKYTIAVIVEYFNSLNAKFIPIEHYLYKLLVNALIKANRLYQLHQYLQYHVLSDSKALACLLLGIESTYPASNQLALDMLKRLGTANEEICDVLLSKGLILSALRFAVQMGLGDELMAAKFLETAKELDDSIIFHEVFKFFEERNVRLRGTPAFKSDENCDIYLRHFASLFHNSNRQTVSPGKNK